MLVNCSTSMWCWAQGMVVHAEEHCKPSKRSGRVGSSIQAKCEGMQATGKSKVVVANLCAGLCRLQIIQFKSVYPEKLKTQTAGLARHWCQHYST